MDATIEETGAVLMGKRAFEMGGPDSYVGNYEFQVPIFVLTHQPPHVQPKQDEHVTFTLPRSTSSGYGRAGSRVGLEDTHTRMRQLGLA